MNIEKKSNLYINNIYVYFTFVFFFFFISLNVRGWLILLTLGPAQTPPARVNRPDVNV